jgi:hypothetical protein
MPNTSWSALSLLLISTLCGCLSSGTVQSNTGTNGPPTTSAAGSGSGTGTTGTTGTNGNTGTDGTSNTSGTSGTTGGITHNTPLDGLTVDLLHFTVTGDCRPSNYVNDASQVAAAYPTQVITQLFNQMGALDPQFTVFTGDVVYTYNPPDTTSAAAQIDLFLQASQAIDRPLAPAMGNHDDVDGTPSVWSQKFNENAYYGFTVHTTPGDVRFTVTDDTYWDSRQLAWVGQELSNGAPYHIVVKHHPSDSTDNDNTQFNTLVSQTPPTLILSGHEHLYRKLMPRELVLGEGGAPLAQSAHSYGFAMIDELSDGSGFQVTVYNSDTDAPTDQWQVSK